MLLLFIEIRWGPGTAVILLFILVLTLYNFTFDIPGVCIFHMLSFILRWNRRSLLL